MFHLYTEEEAKNIVHISMGMSCMNQLADYGVGDAIGALYGPFVDSTEGGYDVTLTVDCLDLPENAAELAHEIALLKRNCLSAPFEAYFDQVGTEVGTCELAYRDNESIFLQASRDRVTIIFSVEFKDADDIVLSQVFLQEFKAANRTVRNCPPVDYTQREPPLELQGERVRTSDNIGFVTFVLFPRHFEAGARRQKSISLIQTFRDYLHYHIKCAKAYMHTRMRRRVVVAAQDPQPRQDGGPEGEEDGVGQALCPRRTRPWTWSRALNTEALPTMILLEDACA